MSSVFSRLRLRLGAEAGHTLIELLVASAAGLVVVGGMVVVLISLVHSQPESTERAGQIQEGRVYMERLVRELRQGSPVTGATANSSQLTVNTYTRSCNGAAPTITAQECLVTYACTQSGAVANCTRKAGTGAPVVAIRGLANPDVFSYATTASSATCSGATTTTPALVCLRFVYPTEADDAITLEDGAYLRNPA